MRMRKVKKLLRQGAEASSSARGKPERMQVYSSEGHGDGKRRVWSDRGIIFPHETGHGDCGKKRPLFEAFDELREDGHAARPYESHVAQYLHDALPSFIGNLRKMNRIGLLCAFAGYADKFRTECLKRKSTVLFRPERQKCFVTDGEDMFRPLPLHDLDL